MAAQFDQIVLINITSLTPGELAELSLHSKNPLKRCDNVPSNDQDTIELLAGCDCVLVSLLVALSEQVISSCSALKYIGVYGTTLRRIHVEAACQRRVTVKNITGYCDFETAEYFMAELLALTRGLTGRSLRQGPSSLSAKRMGIVGLGHVGEKFAQIASALEMNVGYFSRTRKPEAESRGVEFFQLSDLVEQSDVMVLSAPPDICVLKESELTRLQEDSVVMQVSLGAAIDETALRRVLDKTGAFFIFDRVTGVYLQDLMDHPSMVFSAQIAGATEATRARRSEKLRINVRNFLNS